MTVDMFFLRRPHQVQALLDRSLGPVPEKPLFVIVEWAGRGIYEGFPCGGLIPAYADTPAEGLRVIERFAHNKDLCVHALADGLDDAFMLELQDRDPRVSLMVPNTLRPSLG